MTLPPLDDQSEDERREGKLAHLAGKIARDPALHKLTHAFLSAVEAAAKTRLFRPLDFVAYPDAVALGAIILVERVTNDRKGSARG